MPSLPQFQGDNADQLRENAWKRIIDPVVTNPTNLSTVLKDVALTAGANTINHKLGQKLQGWRLCRIRAAATIYDTQDSNPTPTLTLTLVSSAPVTVDLEVY